MMTIAKRKIQKFYFVLILLHFKLEVFCKLRATFFQITCDVTSRTRVSRTEHLTANMSASSTVRETGKRCVAGGPGKISCGNSQHTPGVSIHHFPNKDKEKNRHMQWVRFVRRHRPNWSPSSQSILCSIHFDNSSSTMRRDVAASLGIKSILTSDAIPTIDAANFLPDLDDMPLQNKRKVNRQALFFHSFLALASRFITNFPFLCVKERILRNISI